MKAQHLVSESHQLQGELGKDNTVSKQRCFLRMFLRIVCSGPPDSLWWVFVVVPLLFFPCCYLESTSAFGIYSILQQAALQVNQGPSQRGAEKTSFFFFF